MRKSQGKAAGWVINFGLSKGGKGRSRGGPPVRSAMGEGRGSMFLHSMKKRTEMGEREPRVFTLPASAGSYPYKMGSFLGYKSIAMRI